MKPLICSIFCSCILVFSSCTSTEKKDNTTGSEDTMVVKADSAIDMDSVHNMDSMNH